MPTATRTTARKGRSTKVPVPEAVSEAEVHSSEPDTQAGAVFSLTGLDGTTVWFVIDEMHPHALTITRDEWDRFGRPDKLWVNVELIPEGR